MAFESSAIASVLGFLRGCLAWEPRLFRSCLPKPATLFTFSMFGSVPRLDSAAESERNLFSTFAFAVPEIPVSLPRIVKALNRFNWREVLVFASRDLVGRALAFDAFQCFECAVFVCLLTLVVSKIKLT